MQVDFQFTLFKFRMYHISCGEHNKDRSKIEAEHHQPPWQKY